MKYHSEPIEIESKEEVDIGNVILRTRGLKRYKQFEMELRISQNLTGAPLERMKEVVLIATQELISHDLSNMTVLTIGRYGKLQTELAMNKEQ